jgi:hypothetical protein
VLAGGALDTYSRKWSVRHGVDRHDVTSGRCSALWTAPSQRAGLVYVTTLASTGEAFWGVARSGEAGPEFPVDEELRDVTTALPAALPRLPPWPST